MWQNPEDVYTLEELEKYDTPNRRNVDFAKKARHVKRLNRAVKDIKKQGTGCSGNIAEILAQVITDSSSYKELALPNLFSEISNYIVSIRAGKLAEEFDYIYARSTEEEELFGDWDWGVSKVETGRKNRQVLMFLDRFANDERTAILVIKSEDTIWVRQIWTENEDYTSTLESKKPAYFCDRPNLQYWKDSGWRMNYSSSDKLSIYGDCRDKGYVFDYVYAPCLTMCDGARGSVANYVDIGRFFGVVDSTMLEMKEKQ